MLLPLMHLTDAETGVVGHDSAFAASFQYLELSLGWGLANDQTDPDSAMAPAMMGSSGYA
jgi:hypothetical protein